MSLDVPTALLERAELGDVPDADFVAVVRTSLPYAWQVISQVAGEQDGSVDFTEHAVPPPSEAERGQLLSYPYRGFWQPADTVKERNALEAAYQGGTRPWMLWEDREQDRDPLQAAIAELQNNEQRS